MSPEAADAGGDGAEQTAGGDGARQTGEALRGRLFSELDLLAFALEMEAALRLAEDDPGGAERLQDRRLGVRLAQRLVSGVWADEVDLRLRRWREVYRERLEETRAGEPSPEPAREPPEPAGPSRECDEG